MAALAWRSLPVIVIAVGVVLLAMPIAWSTWFGGDLRYHSALSMAIARGELPPGGPYRDLPAYYPPGFHLMVAGLTAPLGMSFESAIRVLTIAWLPVLPVGTYLLTRHLTGRSGVAALATILTLFAGAFDFSNDRLWVNSLFMVGHVAAPIYPRDIVFALLPWAMYGLTRALESAIASQRHAWFWAVGSGVLFGIMLLTQLQLLLPIPAAALLTGAVFAIRHPSALARITGILLATGAVAVLLVAPWALVMARNVARNEGVAIDGSEALLPALIGFWDFPMQFGILLPFAVVGGGVALLFLRRSSGPAAAGRYGRRWQPSSQEAAFVLIPWALIPFVIGLAYDPSWPLEDALRPQRMFLVASQPMAILAGIGLVAAAEDLGVRWGRTQLITMALAAAILVSTVPVVAANAYRAYSATLEWADGEYAHLDLDADRVPDFRDIIPVSGRRTTVLTYEDWSALAWYETAAWVVAMNPPGYAKLAFDPAIFTGHSQENRRLDILAAFQGDAADTTRVADAYAVDRIVLAKSNGLWGTFDQTASMIPNANDLAVEGGWNTLEGNGWDALFLEPGSRVTLQSHVAGWIELALRVQSGIPRTPSQMRLLAIDPLGTERVLLDTAVERAGAAEDWPVLTWAGGVLADERLVVEAGAELYVQSVRGYTPVAAPPVGWVVESDQPDYVVLKRVSP